MANELVDAVTATPTGPVTIGLGQTLDITASYTLNGPPTGSPTFSSYSLSWQRVGLPASLDSQAPAVAGTVYTKTMGVAHLPVGTHQFKVQGIYINNAGQPDSLVFVDSNLITVHVVAWREGEAPDTTHTEGLATPTTMTEGTANPTTMTEGTATPTTMTEGTATPTTMTEGS